MNGPPAASPSVRKPGIEQMLNAGDRVLLNDKGRRRFKENLDRRGVVVAVSSTRTAYKVRWDGQSTADFLHWTYVTRELEEMKATQSDNARDPQRHVHRPVR